MRLLRLPRVARLLTMLALFQIVAPSVAAIADALRLDERTPYAHVESETGSGCALVHQDDCVLCAVATAPSATPAIRSAFSPATLTRIAAPTVRLVPHSIAVRRCASQRAPPPIRG